MMAEDLKLLFSPLARAGGDGLVGCTHRASKSQKKMPRKEKKDFDTSTHIYDLH